MLKQLTSAEHVIAFDMIGTITADDMKKYKKLFDQKIEKNDRVSFFVDASKLSDITEDGFREGAKADFSVLTHSPQVARCAFVSDKEWPLAAIHLYQRLIPTMELKVFSSKQHDEALKWVAELPAKKQLAPALSLINTNKPNVLGYQVDGIVTSEEMPEFVGKVSAFLKQQEQCRLLVRFKSFGGYDPAVFMQSGLVSMKLTAIKKIERYAVVGAPQWICKVIESMNPLFPEMEMRTFTAEQEPEAWSWLEAKPVQ